MSYISVDQKNVCHYIIHSSSTTAAAIAAGLTQIPAVDMIPIAGVQATMLVSLAKVFDKPLSPDNAVTLLAPYIARAAGRGISQWLTAFLPGIGNAINAITAASLTELMGWHFAEQFATEVSCKTKRIA